MKCAHCRHWAPDATRPPLGACLSKAFTYGYLYPSEVAGKVRPDGALIENDEGWGWLTGPEFGCVQFHAKETVSE